MKEKAYSRSRCSLSIDRNTSKKNFATPFYIFLFAKFDPSAQHVRKLWNFDRAHDKFFTRIFDAYYFVLLDWYKIKNVNETREYIYAEIVRVEL